MARYLNRFKYAPLGPRSWLGVRAHLGVTSPSKGATIGGDQRCVPRHSTRNSDSTTVPALPNRVSFGDLSAPAPWQTTRGEPAFKMNALLVYAPWSSTSSSPPRGHHYSRPRWTSWRSSFRFAPFPHRDVPVQHVGDAAGQEGDVFKLAESLRRCSSRPVLRLHPRSRFYGSGWCTNYRTCRSGTSPDRVSPRPKSSGDARLHGGVRSRASPELSGVRVEKLSSVTQKGGSLPFGTREN